MTSGRSIKSLEERVAALEDIINEEPDGEIWQLIKRERARCGEPPPDKWWSGKRILRDFFRMIRENADTARREQRP